MIGQTLAHYKIIDQLGSGGMSSVFKAIDLRLNRPVALKFLPREMSKNETARKRFEREALAASRLDHPAICAIYDIAETPDGMMYLAMAFYEGETISQTLRRDTIALERAVSVTALLASGLGVAHQAGIIHRDIKPANIIVTKDGQAKLLDFGVAKLAGASRITQEGSVVGTAYYMSPEQTSGLKLDHRSDIWSLGVLLYQMVTGRLPFAGDNPVSVQRAILFEDPTPIDFLEESVGAALWSILERALAKEPADRYQDMRELRQDLDDLWATIAPSTAAAAEEEAEADLEPEPPSEASVVVLPFLDQGEDGSVSFCQGLADELIVRLTRMKRLQVAMHVANGTAENLEDLRKIGESHGVDAVLEGRVARSGDRLRVTARVLQVADGRYLWSERYDREGLDLFAVQDEIAQSIAAEVHRQLVGRPHSSHSGLIGESFEAYLLYLKGRYQWQKRTYEGLRKGIEYFEHSIHKEPQYARAYAGLADSYVMLAIYGYQPPLDVIPRAKAAAEQALRIDDTLAEVYASRGCTRAVYDWDFHRAHGDFERAEKLDPSYAVTYQWRAMNYLLPLGRFEEADKQLRRAWELDPLSLTIATSRGLFYYYRRQYQRSIEEFHKVLELDEGFEPAHVFLGQVYDKQGRYAEALAEFGQAVQLSGGRPDITVALGHAHAQLGHRELARCFLDKLLDESEARYVSPSVLAQVYTALEEFEMALTALERGHKVRSADMIWIGVNPVFDPLRDEPRFQALLDSIGLQDQVATQG